MAKPKNIQSMSTEELNKHLIELRESLFNFRFQKSLQQLEHPQKLRHIKRDVARVKTLIKEIELGIR